MGPSLTFFFRLQELWQSVRLDSVWTATGLEAATLQKLALWLKKVLETEELCEAALAAGAVFDPDVFKREGEGQGFSSHSFQISLLQDPSGPNLLV